MAAYNDEIKIQISAEPGAWVDTCFLTVSRNGMNLVSAMIKDDPTQDAAVDLAGLTAKAAVCNAVEDAINQARSKGGQQ